MFTESSNSSTANSEDLDPDILDPGIMNSIIKDSSSNNRDYFTAYLALLTYVLATVFSTTDLQLLSSSEGIHLPIAGINVPVTGFYIVIPLFVVALHFNFLQNLESHHYKLMCWKKSHLPSQIKRSQIQPFLFDYAELETGGQFDLWVRFVNSFLCLYLAPITLGLLLWRFTDRQEALITIWQFFIFLLDCWLAWKLIHAMILNKQLLNMSPTPARSWLDSLKLIKLVGCFLLLETLLTALLTWLPSKEYIIYINSWAVPFIKMNPRIGPLLLPYLSITSNETVWKPDNNYLETMAKLEGEKDLETFFKTQGQGFKPSTPNLRLANLPGQYIPNAQLKWLQLEGAYLESAKLQGANLSEAHLQAVNLKAADLQGANLTQAQLQDAQLQGANLQGVNLTKAQLQNANLSNAQLQGATLNNTNLQGANLGGVQFQGALLFETKLLGNTLNGADLQGAILHKTELRVDSRPKNAQVFMIEPPVIYAWDQKKKEFGANFSNSDNAASKIIGKLCEDGSQSVAIQGIYNNYFNLTKDFEPLLPIDSELLKNVKERNALGSIKEKLCNDSVCNKLKSKIEKLDCS